MAPVTCKSTYLDLEEHPDLYEYSWFVADWFDRNLTAVLEQIVASYENQIGKLVAESQNTRIKDLKSIKWIKQKQTKMMEFLIHLISRLHSEAKDLDQFLKKKSYQMLKYFNSKLYYLHFVSNKLDYYGFGKYIKPKRMNELDLS